MRKKVKIILLITTVIVISILLSIKSRGKVVDNLTKKQQSIVFISAYTMKGDIKSLNTALINGLENSLSINEIKEILIQMYAYAGFPRSLNGIIAFQKLIEKREADGIFDIQGPMPNILDANIDKNQYGEDVRTNLIGSVTKGAYATFIPVIDDFLKEHLFSDIFSRGVLTNAQREMTTIAALSSVEGLESQLGVHLNIGLNVGLKPEELKDIITLVGIKTSMTVLKDILQKN